MSRSPRHLASAPVETEWQFDAIDVRPVERWLAGARDHVGPSVQEGELSTIVDTYLDTEDWRLYRAGYSLRVRRKHGTAEATLKSLAESRDGLRQRDEYTEPLNGRDVSALVRAAGPVSTRAKLAAGRRPLIPLFSVRTRRQEYRLAMEGDSAGEIAVDRTTIALGNGAESARLRRVEVEVPEPMVPTLAPFVDSMRTASGLHPATLSKYEAGLLARGFQPGATLDFGSRAIDPSMTTGEVAFAVLRRHFASMLVHEPGSRMGDDPEELHDMRVATRRLRAALKLFAAELPVRMARFHDELGWVAAALGAVRDLDVQLEQLDVWTKELEPQDAAALRALRATLEDEYRTAREEMLATLDSPRYDRLVASMAAALRRGPLRTSRASRAPVLATAPDFVLNRYRAVRKAARRIGPSASPRDYHRLRIRAKRLRYALEFLQDVYPEEIPPVVRRLIELQNLLGAHQDADVAVRRLRSTAAERGSALPPDTVLAMGIITQRYLDEAAELRRRFPSVNGRLSGRSWRTVKKAMNRRRPEPATPTRTATPSLVPSELGA